MNRLLCIGFILLLRGVSIAQPIHAFKLADGVLIDESYRKIQGTSVLAAYTVELKTLEDGDSIIYLEKYAYTKEWKLLRYKLENGKPKLEGWQQDFNNEGQLVLQQLCDGTWKCAQSRKYTYYPGKQLLSVGDYFNDRLHGHHYLYYSNGSLRQHIWFQEGRMQEVLAYYDESGQPLDAGTLCDGEGEVPVYSMDGTHYKTKIYRKGKVRKVKEVVR
jgi:antitoxin component YwqK of YwqJK toxin-antitoxin module